MWNNLKKRWNHWKMKRAVIKHIARRLVDADHFTYDWELQHTHDLVPHTSVHIVKVFLKVPNEA